MNFTPCISTTTTTTKIFDLGQQQTLKLRLKNNVITGKICSPNQARIDFTSQQMSICDKKPRKVFHPLADYIANNGGNVTAVFNSVISADTGFNSQGQIASLFLSKV